MCRDTQKISYRTVNRRFQAFIILFSAATHNKCKKLIIIKIILNIAIIVIITLLNHNYGMIILENIVNIVFKFLAQ